MLDPAGSPAAGHATDDWPVVRAADGGMRSGAHAHTESTTVEPSQSVTVLDAGKAGGELLRGGMPERSSSPAGRAALDGDAVAIGRARALALSLAACCLREAFVHPVWSPAGAAVRPSAAIAFRKVQSVGHEGRAVAAAGGPAPSSSPTGGLEGTTRAQDLYYFGDNSWNLSAGHASEDVVPVPRPVG